MNRRSVLLLLLFLLAEQGARAQPRPEHNLSFESLAKRWDEAIPLGNGWLGALIWQKGDKLRMSLDRVDLWDDRPMPEIDKLKFSWVVEKVKKNQYDSVQKIGDEPYEKYPAPTKIPGAALEFDLAKLGKVTSNELDIKSGLNTIQFDNGIIFRSYIHAVNQTGYFAFENISSAIIPALMAPNYNSGKQGSTGNSVEGHGLERLGYKKGTVTQTANSILYHQPTWSNNYYEVLVKWQQFPGKRIIGQWTITNNKPAVLPVLSTTVKEPTGWPSHSKWWNDYWSRSAVSLPDKLLERQYYLEMYKFGCVARPNTPPISLQAVWTADNGNLPPWKGDFHHDLNTQLSYWPGYTGNHLDLTASYTNWLWKVKKENERWTQDYFELRGLNVPGVTTISGKPMGGWIQYSMSPTTAAWLAQHFYWQWKYSMDEKFFNEKAYPYIDNVSVFIVNQATRFLSNPENIISSSPEYHDNSINAWFRSFTNYDLALIRNQVSMQVKLMDHKMSDSRKRNYLRALLDTLPYFDTNETGLTVAPKQNLGESHRHMSPYMAIHPLGLLNIENDKEKSIIEKSIQQIEKKGTRAWVGYSFPWMACIYARAQKADSAVINLRKFATNFCSPNSFHLNGDQKGGQYAAGTYRPFTLEGNFAFAQGVHELLLQSHKGFIEVFPAIPQSWNDISFTTLRAEGAFLVSAKKEKGVATEIKIKAEQGGILNIKLPFKEWRVEGISREKITTENSITTMPAIKGQIIIFKPD